MIILHCEHRVRCGVLTLHHKTKTYRIMQEKKTLLANENTKILVPAKSLNISEDDRLLIPFTDREKIGFINQEGEIIVAPQFNAYYGECYSENDIIKVAQVYSYGFPRSEGKVTTYTRLLYGIIDYQGKTILEPNYLLILPAIGNKNLFTVQDRDYRYRVITADGKEIVPSGKYMWIDGFNKGLARVITHKPANNKDGYEKVCGLINEQGEEVVPCSNCYIRNFYGKDYDTIEFQGHATLTRVPFASLAKNTEEGETSEKQ